MKYAGSRIFRALATALLLSALGLVSACGGSGGESGGALSVRVVAAGDNILHEQILRASRTEGGGYDFSGAYEPVRPLVEAADFAYVNQETICGGAGLRVSGWPEFNSPPEALDALAGAGFDWISAATNHTLDRGEAGVRAELEYLEENLPGLVCTGIHASATDRAAPKTVTVNGVTLGLASYTYGLNGKEPPEGEEWLVDVIDEGRIGEDLRALTAASDVQIVSLHWGEEYEKEPSGGQRALAQKLADLGCDVILGTHPHVAQPMEILAGAGGGQTLVYYSLGNFLSAQDEPERLLGEMARFTILYDPDTGTVSFEDAGAVPLVTHISKDFRTFAVYPREGYTRELAAGHAYADALAGYL
ncbi:MAG: CapA family protein [Clostridiales Family XIII bacterium]|jgi:poly-gamma-glutamate synthesis protein (capsule biosynthesis protein)|nr:CapA family protein [Clostridiales Family XIII bacterium]